MSKAILTYKMHEGKSKKFRNEEHKPRYLHLLNRMKSRDEYNQTTAYLMALVPLHADDVFDFLM